MNDLAGEHARCPPQNQALAAILFLYRDVLHQDLDALDLDAIRAAAQAAGMVKPVGPHTFRHSFTSSTGGGSAVRVPMDQE